MRFLIDQDVYAVTAKFLIDAGHDVILVSEIGLAQASDEEILTVAQSENRILVTRDRDYGNLVFVRVIGTGVIYLRVLPKTVNAVHNELARVIETYSNELELKRSPRTFTDNSLLSKAMRSGVKPNVVLGSIKTSVICRAVGAENVNT